MNNNRPDNGEFIIDSIINSEELEKLRRKYERVDSETAGTENPEPPTKKESADELSASSTVPPTDKGQDCISKYLTSETQPDDESSPTAQPQSPEAKTLPEDSIEKLTYSFRTIYKDSVTKLNDLTPRTSEDPQPPAQTGNAELESTFISDSYNPPAELADPNQNANKEEISPRENRFKHLMKKIFPSKGDSIGESIRKIVLFSAIVTMLVCGGILLNRYVITPFFGELEAKKTSEIWIQSNDGNADWSIVKSKYPDVVFPQGMLPKFADLYVTNPDFVGWLEIPGIDINMPIVQGQNNSIYLTKTFYMEESKHGCGFVDSSNNIAQLDRNTIIYGHNMNYDDLMFSPIEAYKKAAGFKASPIIKFDTLFKDTRWKIYAVYITNGEASGDNGYVFNYLFRNLSSEEVFMSYIHEVDQRKLYETGVDILPTDKILTLSTCTYDFFRARLVVVARLLREGESEDVDVSNVVINKNPRYPQNWYVASKRSNPYKDANKWFPS